MTEPQPEIKPVVVQAETPGYGARARSGTANWLSSHTPPNKANQPLFGSKMPTLLANRQTIVLSWGVAVGVLSWHDWHDNHILPRPSRLWQATWFYLLLILVGLVDALVPIANAFAIGYTIMLIWQYYQGNLE